MDSQPQPATPDAGTSLDFEALLWELFLRLMDAPGNMVEAEIVAAQRRLCRALDLDRSALWQTRPAEPGRFFVTHVYTTEHDDKPGVFQDGSLPGEAGPEFRLFDFALSRHADASDHFDWVVRRTCDGLTTVITSLDELPAEAARDAEAFRRFGTLSTVLVPLTAGGEVLGCLSFAATRAARQWEPALIARFERLAQVFAKALFRKRADERLREALDELRRLREQLEHENVYLKSEVRERRMPAQIVGTSMAIRRTVTLVEQVAPTATTVLLTGETGSGKERVAAAIHELSPRKARAMVKVNCAAIPDTLIESELFGREKGAYTGALTRQIGRFELASGSTIFLDEIGDLPLETQAKLLRVIETREFERLGSPNPIRVDVRIIAATNRNLERAVQEGRFREDLLFRVNVFPINVPPLRERLEDLPLLVTALVDELSASMGRRFDAVERSSIVALQHYHWPGNIRELRNVVERAMITSDGPVLHIDPPTPAGRTRGSSARTLRSLEREHILETLQQTGWRIRGPWGAAVILGLPPTTLENRMARLGIFRPGKNLPNR